MAYFKKKQMFTYLQGLFFKFLDVKADLRKNCSTKWKTHSNYPQSCIYCLAIHIFYVLCRKWSMPSLSQSGTFGWHRYGPMYAYPYILLEYGICHSLSGLDPYWTSTMHTTIFSVLYVVCRVWDMPSWQEWTLWWASTQPSSLSWCTSSWAPCPTSPWAPSPLSASLLPRKNSYSFSLRPWCLNSSLG